MCNLWVEIADGKLMDIHTNISPLRVTGNGMNWEMGSYFKILQSYKVCAENLQCFLPGTNSKSWNQNVSITALYCMETQSCLTVLGDSPASRKCAQMVSYGNHPI